MPWVPWLVRQAPLGVPLRCEQAGLLYLEASLTPAVAGGAGVLEEGPEWAPLTAPDSMQVWSQTDLGCELGAIAYRLRTWTSSVSPF